MMRASRKIHHRRRVSIMVGAGLALGAAIFPLSASQAGEDAKPAVGSQGFFATMLETFNVKTTVGPTPDFVEATHPDPASLKFIPTSTPHPKRTVDVKSAAGIESAKAALDAARDAQLQPKAVSSQKTTKKVRLAKPGQSSAGN